MAAQPTCSDEQARRPTCGLYQEGPVARVERELVELTGAGIDSDAPLTAELLQPIDTMHYCGTAGLEALVAKLGVGADTKALDVGSGFGGCSRWLASQTRCHVTALELQADISDFAAQLTARCALQDLVAHATGNILDAQQPLPHPAYDVWFSFLVFLHIDDRATLFSQLRARTAPGGQFYIEDYFARGPLTAEEQDLLATKVGTSRQLPTLDEYAQQLRAAGFECECEDVTSEWAPWVAERCQAYRAAQARHLQVHGEACTANMLDFYGAVEALFQGGRLGGCVIRGRAAA